MDTKNVFFCPLEAGVKKRTLQNPVVFLLTHPLLYELWSYELCSTVYKFTLQYNCQQLVEMNAIENEKKIYQYSHHAYKSQFKQG